MKSRTEICNNNDLHGKKINCRRVQTIILIKTSCEPFLLFVLNTNNVCNFQPPFKFRLLGPPFRTRQVKNYELDKCAIILCRSSVILMIYAVHLNLLHRLITSLFFRHSIPPIPPPPPAIEEIIHNRVLP